MNAAQMKRLEPFLRKKSARQRVILALVVEGHEVTALEAWTVADLRAAELPSSLTFYRDQLLEERGKVDKSAPAFCYPNGLQLRAHDFYRILRQATTRVMGEPAAPAAFRDYVRKGEKV
jgi:hypothetical protein